MKKSYLSLLLALVFAFSIPQTARANMAEPEDADIGSSITFQKNDAIAVLSEVLDITVEGTQANIVATYQMKNTTGENVSTPAMFLSPNVSDSGVQVTVNGKSTLFEIQSFALKYDTEIQTVDWRYAVLTDSKTADPNADQRVDSITFEMDFAPNQEYDVVVSYTYRLGGYPDYDFNAKNGLIEYYLAPAAMWKDFEKLTINLYLDEDMPVISSSNLEFSKVGTRTYQYVSDTLPAENLKIVIDENWYQNIFSTLKSPYLFMTLMIILPPIVVALVAAALIIWFLRRNRRQKNSHP